MLPTQAYATVYPVVTIMRDPGGSITRIVFCRLKMIRQKAFIFADRSTVMEEFKKYFIIPATPEEVYNALTNPLAIRLWTGEPAEMSEGPDQIFFMGRQYLRKEHFIYSRKKN